ncbi:hypothetical protein ABZW11_15865 [Nonomuraea sp. NPDC004580]|uniref:hypothetical protein n=1 Tax=Nonomuraea sp. NPDC004580 TaxID=3154552 RepID=UPI0033B6C2BC
MWPPAPREPVGGATQPIPAVRTAGPPPQYRPGAPAQPPVAPPTAAGAPGLAAGEGQSFAQGAPSAEPFPGPEASGQGPAEGTGPQGGGRSKRRTALVAAAAVLACLLTTAAQTYDGHAFYEKVSEEETKEIIVAAGQAGKVNGVEWKAAVSRTEAPQNSKHGPEVTWLKVDITRKVVDKGSATMVAEPTDVQVQDRAGRIWTAPIEAVGDRPTDRLVVGEEYKIQGLAIVPTPVANEVELSFRPSNYRSDTPTDELFTREGAEKLVPDVEVLRFRRR